jgi:hypothetical protein
MRRDFCTKLRATRFSPAMFTAHFYPTVRTPAGDFDILTPGYRDAFCAQIAKVVTDAYRLPGEKLVIEFEDDSLVEVSLTVEDQSEPEAATFFDSKKGFMVWRFGED